MKTFLKIFGAIAASVAAFLGLTALFHHKKEQE